jgi:type IV secretory pathway ATPase VirB11/archaellum biosynthesis ATPase
MANNAEAQELAVHLALLKAIEGHQDQHELSGTPIFTMPVLKHSKHLFSQYGFIAGISEVLESNYTDDLIPLAGDSTDPRLFFNISAPSSAFICGSQGSGKLSLSNAPCCN